MELKRNYLDVLLYNRFTFEANPIKAGHHSRITLKDTKKPIIQSKYTKPGRVLHNTCSLFNNKQFHITSISSGIKEIITKTHRSVTLPRFHAETDIPVVLYLAPPVPHGVTADPLNPFVQLF